MSARGRKRRIMLRRIAAITMVLALVGVGAGVAFYRHLNSNLRTAALTAAAGGTATSDSEGGSAINVLVLGSDTRSSKADCKIGGDCSTSSSTSTTATSESANADVLMLVHISADRKSSTIMSIPRDTVTSLPACTDSTSGSSVAARTGQINSTLQYGANCTVAAVHQLTGITINHFVVIDFAGVVKMSDAVGGVKVCVNNNVYDPYSHLKLSKGTHTLKGLAALQYLRTRHGFGDGSDLGRSAAQHLFLASMLRQMESASTLTNPVKVLNLANAATSAVTVDTGLGSVKDLANLAYQLNKVSSANTTFVTMPTQTDPTNINRVVPASSAEKLFAKIANDVDSSSSSKKSASASTSTSDSGSTTSKTSTSSANSSSSTSDSTTAKNATGCAQVSTADTVTVNGVSMTPSEAYAVSTSVKDSDS